MAKTQRNGHRKPRTSQTRVPHMGYYCIITDTKETEINYILGFKESLPEEYRDKIVIKVIKSETDNMVKRCKEEVAKMPQYGELWIVFDRDRVVRFDEIIKQAEKENIKVGWSNPCIETWFDAYLGAMQYCSDSVACCHKFGEKFERISGKEYKKSSKQIYEFLCRYGKEEDAIKIAKNKLQHYLNAGTTKPSEM